MGCQILEHVIPDGNALAAAERFEHLQTGIVIRVHELHGKAPLETRQKPVLEILQVYRRAVGSEYKLLSGLVQVIENIEESRLGAGSLKILYVIYDEHVYLLVEPQEISHLVTHIDRIHILGLELVSADIQDNEFRELLMDGYTDSLGQMRLAESGTAEDEQRVERSLAGCRRNSRTRRIPHLVALTYYKIGKTIYRIQFRIDLNLPEAGIYKGIGIAGGIDIDAHFSVDGGGTGSGRDCDSRLSAYGPHKINQFRIRAYDPFQSLLDNIQISRLQILPEEIGRHLHGEGRIHHGDRPYGFEPGRVLLRFHDLFNNPQEMVPDTYMSVVLVH